MQLCLLSEAKMAITYFLSNTNDEVNLIVKSDQIYTEENVIRFLEDGHVLYIARGVYSNNTVLRRESGHAIVIWGYVYIDGEYRFLIRDPSPLTTGSTLVVSYQWLVNGQNAQSGASSNLTIWDGTLVCTTLYSNDTIPYYFEQSNP